jgi:hypothetical protein
MLLAHVVPSIFCLNVEEEYLFKPKKSRGAQKDAAAKSPLKRQRQQVPPTSDDPLWTELLERQVDKGDGEHRHNEPAPVNHPGTR